jgi:PadR family transcriptional regulator, regulatory protein PadR
MSSMRRPTYFILASLLDGPLHGYGIIKRTLELTDGDLALTAGTLYGALGRLVDEGLIAAGRSERVAGRERRYYEITDLGRETVRQESAQLSAAAHVVQQRLARSVVLP